MQSKDAEYKPELRSIFSATRSVVFFGTPHRGADWADFAAKITTLAIGKNDKRVLNSLKIDSEVLETLMDRFAVMLRGNDFRVTSFIEGQSMSDMPGLSSKVRSETSQRLL